jgi:hypothetical protein
MVDPIQGTQGQQQGQQQYHDDILGGEDIFATIPEMEDDLPYGDVLEKKYQFEPIPEVVSEEPTPEPAQAPVVPSVIDQIAEQEVQDIVQQAGVEQETVETLLDTQLQTDVQKKFGELFFTTKRIYAIKTKL